MRYERKYRLEQVALPVVEQVIRQHPAGFRPLYPPRWINNLYFDTPDFQFFKDNVVGAPQRLKYRLRWYGRPFAALSNPVLEVKIKDNMVGRKAYHRLPQRNYQATDLPQLVAACRGLAGTGKTLQPLLFNSYYRSYWGAPALPFRLTIDSQLQFGAYRPLPRPVLPYRDESVVVEVKYDAAEDEQSAFVLQHLPFRLSKNSKYVTGINFVYG
ncbi:MAG: VTC domain-containing protein [Bacteroidetes bacterium]|nr:VTC domain-containing protein [Bacteroidota bacterium]